MARTYGWSASQIGLALGIALSVSGMLGQFICGRIVDSMVRRGVRDAQLRWYAGCLLVGTPIGMLATTSGNSWVFVIGIGVFLVFISSLGACGATALNLITPNELRGTGIAFWAGTSGLVGAACGPMLIAFASERLFHGASALGFGMATVIGIGCPIAALFLALGFGAMREAMKEAESWAV
jgi:MFS family permease